MKTQTHRSHTIKEIERGDIILINLNPTIGQEIQGEARPALVISSKAFNAKGLAVVCPISQGNAQMARNGDFFVTLMGYGLNTNGGIVANQFRTIDWRNRIIRKIERISTTQIKQIQDILTAIIND